MTRPTDRPTGDRIVIRLGSNEIRDKPHNRISFPQTVAAEPDATGGARNTGDKAPSDALVPPFLAGFPPAWAVDSRSEYLLVTQQPRLFTGARFEDVEHRSLGKDRVAMIPKPYMPDNEGQIGPDSRPELKHDTETRLQYGDELHFVVTRQMLRGETQINRQTGYDGEPLVWVLTTKQWSKVVSGAETLPRL